MMEQVYCVMDMPLTVIHNYLSPKESSPTRKPIITSLAADCLRQVASQPENIQMAVIEGELPLYHFCSSAIN